MMKKGSEAVSRLNEQIEEAIQKHPHNKNIFHAFRSILREKKRLVEGGISANLDVASVDMVHLKGGTPLCTQVTLVYPDEQWKKIALTMIPAIIEGFPALKGELKKIEQAIKKGTLTLKDYFTPFPELNDEIALNWATVIDIRPEALHLFLKSTLRPVLEAKAKKAISLLGEFTWDKGYCPVCGAFPGIAVIKDKITERWLHCSQCGHQWRFNRILCPYCEYESKEGGSTYFFVESNDQECAFVCDQCNRYLITVKRVRDITEHDFDVVSMGLVHLDALMQEKGFSPVAPMEWNLFETGHSQARAHN